jgi:molybdate transport system substrate-binding protein
MQRIAADFERATGHKALVSTGSTGKFYAQIMNGAPFEVLLSADEPTPKRPEAQGAAVVGSRFPYAIGRLVLWSARAGFVDAGAEVLRKGDFRHLALANPKTAPYGAAAMQTMEHLKLLETLAPRFVQGENIAQAHQFVASGNAELGFVALSQVWRDGRIAEGSGWIVPEALHAPIRQDAVLLARGRDRPAALALLRYLRTDAARRIILAAGYELPPPDVQQR